MIKLRNIVSNYSDNEKKAVLNGISCDINQGDFIVLVGQNGAGKSTFLSLLAGIIKPVSGSIVLNQKNIVCMDQVERAEFISILFQDPNLNCISSMTVAQNLALVTYKKRVIGFDEGLKSLPVDFLEVLAKEWYIDFSEILEKPMSILSGGQRQFVSFIMSMIVPPQLLLLDEPTASLDPQSATILLSCVKRYVKKNSIATILVTHDPHLALALGTKIWVLENGSIKQYIHNEKSNLAAEDLIGSINYTALKNH